jgi:hypothetical protein
MPFNIQKDANINVEIFPVYNSMYGPSQNHKNHSVTIALLASISLTKVIRVFALLRQPAMMLYYVNCNTAILRAMEQDVCREGWNPSFSP